MPDDIGVSHFIAFKWPDLGRYVCQRTWVHHGIRYYRVSCCNVVSLITDHSNDIKSAWIT